MTSWWIIIINYICLASIYWILVYKIFWCKQYYTFHIESLHTCGFDKQLSTKKKTSGTKQRLQKAEWVWGPSPAVPVKLQHNQQSSRNITHLCTDEAFTTLHPSLRIPPHTSQPTTSFPIWSDWRLATPGRLLSLQQPTPASLMSSKASRCSQCWWEPCPSAQEELSLQLFRSLHLF